MVFGSHDSHIYCTDTSGRLEWKVKVDSPVYSTPFVFHLPQHTQDLQEMVIHSDNSTHQTKCCQGNIIENFQDCDPHSECIQMTANNMDAVAGNYNNNSQPVLSMVGNEKCENLKQKQTRQSTTETIRFPETNVIEEHMDLVAVCSTRGTLYVLTLASGAVLKTHQFAGETFSSPVVLASEGGFVVVIGCRDDYVYCVRFSQQATIPRR